MFLLMFVGGRNVSMDLVTKAAFHAFLNIDREVENLREINHVHIDSDCYQEAR